MRTIHGRGNEEEERSTYYLLVNSEGLALALKTALPSRSRDACGLSQSHDVPLGVGNTKADPPGWVVTANPRELLAVCTSDLPASVTNTSELQGGTWQT